MRERVTIRRSTPITADPRADDRPREETAEDAMSLERLIRSDGSFVARTLRRAGVSDDAVDDAVQQVFLVAARKLGAVRAGSERPFLLGIALNVAAHARRRVARLREVDDDREELWDGAPLPDDALDAARLASVVWKALEALPADLRAVLILVDVDEHTMAHAADALAIPRGTVASRLRRARERLAEAVCRVRPSRRIRAAARH